MNKNVLWAIDIVKLGEEVPFKTVHLIGQNFFEVSHTVGEYIFEADLFDFPVDVLNIRKVLGVEEILNAQDFMEEHERYDPEEPYRMAENAPSDQVIKFKCTCQNEVKVMNSPWPFIKCKDCSRTILHRDLENVAGIWIYHPSN